MPSSENPSKFGRTRVVDRRRLLQDNLSGGTYGRPQVGREVGHHLAVAGAVPEIPHLRDGNIGDRPVVGLNLQPIEAVIDIMGQHHQRIPRRQIQESYSTTGQFRLSGLRD